MGDLGMTKKKNDQFLSSVIKFVETKILQKNTCKEISGSRIAWMQHEIDSWRFEELWFKRLHNKVGTSV